MASHPQNPQENLLALITRHQAALHAYILSPLPNQAKADDVLQETNLVLWRKAADYDQAMPFMPWACRIAWFGSVRHATTRLGTALVSSA